MKNKVILSSIVATLLVSPLSALNMLDRFEAIEHEMKILKAENSLLKSSGKSIELMEKETESLKSEILLLKSNDKSIGMMEKEMEALKAEILLLKSTENSIEDDEESDESDEDSEEAEEESEDSKEAEEGSEDSDEDSEEDEDEEKVSVEEMLEEIQDNLTDLNMATSGSHLKFDVDYRFSVDNLQYEMADGSKQSNDAFLVNRLWINMDWAATDTVSFHGQLAYNKAFGNRAAATPMHGNQFENYDWVTNENPYDGTLRVRSAYFYYANDTFLGTDVAWTFSIGRRGSTNGAPVNLREDDGLSSPLGHTMNVEFDGLSTKFTFSEWIEGMRLQFCLGRGASNANPKFAFAPYATDDSDIPNIDLRGIVFTGYDDGQYLLKTQYYFAENLIDIKGPTYAEGFKSVGNMHSATALFKITGIGNEINDYLDDTTFFMSAAITKTDPDAGESMLGSQDSETGYSYWVGTQVPSLFTEDGRMGIEYNHGSQYWRSITYGEDTLAGSKIATRGDAYEIYFTEYLVDDILSMQLRYTYMDYKYTGSNGFFGSTTGTAVKITDDMPNGFMHVDKAQDLRFYIRYNY